MKKAWTLIILFVFAVGFFMGRAIPGPKEVPDIPETRQVAAYAAATPVPASATDAQIVYISRNAIMHRKPNCSGMKYYTEKTYGEAVDYYRKCSKCW